MDVYAAKDYRQYVQFCLKSKESPIARGGITRFAENIRTHPTHISQVLTGKAEFSIEQAIGFCKFVGLDHDACEYFMDLLQRDRAGSPDAKKHFEQRLLKRRKERAAIHKRLKLKNQLTSEQKAYYFQDWIPQAVHMLAQTSPEPDAVMMAKRFGVPLKRIEETIARLVEMGFVQIQEGKISSLRKDAFIGADEVYVNRLHTNWRLKTLNEIQSFGTEGALHYSSVISIDQQTAKAINALILQHIETVAETILPAPERELYAYCFDFYPLRSRE